MKTVIVCDSGLGGLNIAAGFFNEANREKEACRLIYFNAYPEKDRGFNKLPSLRSQEELFREVLESMKNFSPDVCLIACNTLSIVYERLEKWYQPDFPVIGIVDVAVEKMFTALQKDADSRLLILGTKGTVESQVYEKKLIKRGIAPERIAALACPGLATLLESDPNAEEVAAKIANYAAEAENLLDKSAAKVLLGLCCTHFEFAEKFWLKEFGSRFGGQLEIVNPNRAFPAEYFPAECRYVSRIDFFEGAREAMTEYFAKSSPELADSLAKAVIDPELFQPFGETK